MSVEVACALLEACGRYLFRTAHTHDRLVHYLDVMLRLKKVSQQPSHQNAGRSKPIPSPKKPHLFERSLALL